MEPAINRAFYMQLIDRTQNFHTTRWIGHQTWQSVFDAWTAAEVIADVKPDLIIECGTYQGGSALFYADLLTLLGKGRVISIDTERLHNLAHAKVEFWLGSSTSPDIVSRAGEAAEACRGPVMVVLDSDHTRDHVLSEMEHYSALVTRGSYMMVQDGIIDVLPTMKAGRPGPLVAIRDFLQHHPEFEVDYQRSDQFLVSHSPMGWLRRR
jgi:cephalosporin hydroxylase